MTSQKGQKCQNIKNKHLIFTLLENYQIYLMTNYTDQINFEKVDAFFSCTDTKVLRFLTKLRSNAHVIVCLPTDTE